MTRTLEASTTTTAGSLRRTGVLVGACFLLATVAYLAGSGLIQSVTGEERYLTIAWAERHRLFAGMLLQLVNCGAVVTIAVLLFPVLRWGSEPVAVGYLAARLTESVILAIAALSPLLLVTLGAGHAGEAALADTLGRMIVAGDEAGFRTAMIALGLGSLPLCSGLYRWQLVPRPLALLGLVGYALLLLWGVLGVLLGKDASTVLFAPGAIFELALPVWLFVRGLDPSALPRRPAGQGARV
jgi:Domain of unknown function (DUF4386)